MHDFLRKMMSFAWARTIGGLLIVWLIAGTVNGLPAQTTAQTSRTCSLDLNQAQTLAPSTDIAPRDVRTDFVLEDILREANEPAEVVLPNVNERLVVMQLFARTLDLEPSEQTNRPARESAFDQLRAEWASWEMELTTLVLSTGETVWLIRERADARQGRGIYTIRPKADIPSILQAPHGRYDRHTRRIVARLFVEGRWKAAAWNTVHRDWLDLAHDERTYFQAFTLAAAMTVPHATVVQVHGFDERKRKTSVGRKAALIVSNGTHFPNAWFAPTAHQLAERLHPIDVRIYPFDVRELGGTTNVQAELFHGVGGGRFLHLEYNRSLRQRLVEDRPFRDELLLALSRACRD